MPVHQNRGVVLVQQVHQRVKAPVGRVLVVAQTGRGRVGYDNVHAAHPFEFPGQLCDSRPHLAVGILVGAGMIPAAAAKPQNADAVIFHDVPVDAVTALGGHLIVVYVMIAVDIQYRTFCHGDQKAQVFGVQVTAGKNQVVIIQPAGGVVIPQGGALLIGDGQNLHG